MAHKFYKWSLTAETNAIADPAVDWQEGQSPSSINDSARAMMSSAAAFRDDISGAIVTGGSSTAYTLATNQVFDGLSSMGGKIVAFTPHATNGNTVTLNVDGLGAKPLRSAPSVELFAGTLIQGTPYVALYNASDAVFYLHGFTGNPYNIPLGAGMDYWLPTAPNSSFVFPIGQAISRSTYATLFALMGTTYGSGDGSTTFNLPDKRGRVSAALDASAGRLTDAVSGFGDGLGEAGGSQTHTLSTAELAAHTHANSLNDSGHTHSYNQSNLSANGATGGGGNHSINLGTPTFSATSGSSTTGISITNASAGSGNAHANVQPTICCNYILRII